MREIVETLLIAIVLVIASSISSFKAGGAP
jgi:hypothetical protein